LRQRKDQKEKQLTKTKNKKIQTQSINKNEAIKIPTPKEITENKNMFGLLNIKNKFNNQIIINNNQILIIKHQNDLKFKT
jgi:hypothetical protein